MDARSDYLTAGEVVVALVDRIPASAYAGPGLGEWDLRALVGHTTRAFSTVADYLDRPAQTEDLTSPVDYLAPISTATVDHAAVTQRGVAAGEALGDDPSSAVRAERDRAVAALDRTPDDAVVEVLGGGIRVASYLPTRTLELVVHGLDVAHATGLEATFPDDVVVGVLDLLGRVGVRNGRGPELLRALTGRSGTGISLLG